MSKKHAVIIGAGPAGLTAAYYLAKDTNIKPIVLEKETFVGGISRTMNFNGNRMDEAFWTALEEALQINY